MVLECVVKPVFKFIVARLGEISTWKGAFLILTAGGAAIHPDLQNAIITIGLAVVGALGVATPDPAPSAGE
jgi:hypothetical protein